MLLSRLPLGVCLVFSTTASAQHDWYQEQQFRKSVEKAMASVRQILETTRNPQLAEDEEHTYNDKFALAEFLTNSAVAAQMNTLELALGVSPDMFDKVWQKVHDDKRSVTLRFEGDISTKFVKEVEVSVVTSETEVEEVEITEKGARPGGLWNGWSDEKAKTTKTKISKNMLERHWNTELSTRLTLFFGNEPEKTMELHSRNASKPTVTSGGMATKKRRTNQPNPPDNTDHYGPYDVDLTWLIQTISREKVAQFSIDRLSDTANATCKTPRRNTDIDNAVRFQNQLVAWVQKVVQVFRYDIQQLHHHDTQMEKYHQLSNSLFLPTLPLLENSTTLSDLDFGKFLQEHSRRLDGAIKQLEDHSDSEALLSPAEAKLILMGIHVEDLVKQYRESINYIEGMLRNQLVQAIGKELSPEDFNTYMSSHHKKLFGPIYSPQLFSYAVRRPEHYPDGSLSIEKRSLTKTRKSGYYGIKK